jgi:ADP-ribose pyrophosphatase YjhB (NUDIX family)
MATYQYGEYIGRTAQVSVGCSAIIFDPPGTKILLTRRSDNGRWCLPSGRLDSGESVEECCVREVWEETGLKVRITRLVGVYSTPHRITVYADGNRWQVIALSFVAEIIGGELGLSDETTEVGYFKLDELDRLDLMEPHRERIEDALNPEVSVYVK